MEKDILTVIEEASTGFSKGQRVIAKYILENYDKAAFMTASKLGKTVNVSESTVVRFASELGYEGYPEFQKALQELIKNKLTSIQRMEITSSKIGDEDVLKTVINSDIDKLRQTLDTVSGRDFESAVTTIVNAKTVYVFGTRTCATIASFLGLYLNMLLPNVRIVTANSASEVFEQMYRIDEDDVLVAISYPRYSMRTYNGVKFASDKKAKVVAITDSLASPIVEYSSCALVARCDMGNFVDSLVAPLSLVNALIVAIVMRNKTEAAETFESLEDIWKKYQVYSDMEGFEK